MIERFVKRAAPFAVLALGLGLSGCNFNVGWEDVKGVELSALDTSGDAPSRITLAGPDQVIITEGGGFEVSVEGDDEAAAALRFDLQDGKLTIARDREVYNGSKSAIIRMTMPAPAGLGIAGSGKIESASMASDASIDIAGSGEIVVTELTAEKLDIDIAGSGDVSASGAAQKLYVDIAGAGDVRLAGLKADDVKIEIAGSGNVDLASDGTVDVQIAGSGDVNVTGSATCSMEKAGSGSLTCTAVTEADSAEAE